MIVCQTANKQRSTRVEGIAWAKGELAVWHHRSRFSYEGLLQRRVVVQLCSLGGRMRRAVVAPRFMVKRSGVDRLTGLCVASSRAVGQQLVPGGVGVASYFAVFVTGDDFVIERQSSSPDAVELGYCSRSRRARIVSGACGEELESFHRRSYPWEGVAGGQGIRYIVWSAHPHNVFAVGWTTCCAAPIVVQRNKNIAVTRSVCAPAGPAGPRVVLSTCWRPDGTQMALGFGDHVGVFDVSWEPIRADPDRWFVSFTELRRYDVGANFVAWSPDGCVLACHDGRHTLTFLDME